MNFSVVIRAKQLYITVDFVDSLSRGLFGNLDAIHLLTYNCFFKYQQTEEIQYPINFKK